MKIVYNNIIPFNGFKAVNLFGILFVRKDAELSEEGLNHERIHTEQIKELLYIGFYLWYLIEVFVRRFQCDNWHTAYHNISLEREAYEMQGIPDYLDSRPRFAFMQYLKGGVS